MPQMPIPTRASKARIHEFAENVSRKLQFEIGDPIEPLVSKLGGTIEYKNVDIDSHEIPESIVVNSYSDFVVFVSTMTSPQRDKFTIAHELGHLFLHYPLVQKQTPGHSMVATRWVNENDADQQRCEWEANWFAAGFLMPHTEFAEAINDYGHDMDMVAARFGVSRAAVDVRRQSLNL